MREVVTPDDVEQVMRQAVDLLGAETEVSKWIRPAADLEWTCWETVDHMSDDLFAYGMQLTGVGLARQDNLPFACEPRRPGGPALTTYTPPGAGVAGLLANFEACGVMLATMARHASPQTRGYHVFGLADAEGFAAMGLVEVLIHTNDVARVFGREWAPPDDVCGRVVARLFPHVPGDLPSPDHWRTLQWACGRIALPPIQRLDRWRWYGEPLPV